MADHEPKQRQPSLMSEPLKQKNEQDPEIGELRREVADLRLSLQHFYREMNDKTKTVRVSEEKARQHAHASLGSQMAASAAAQESMHWSLNAQQQAIAAHAQYYAAASHAAIAKAAATPQTAGAASAAATGLSQDDDDRLVGSQDDAVRPADDDSLE